MVTISQYEYEEEDQENLEEEIRSNRELPPVVYCVKETETFFSAEVKPPRFW